MSRSAGVIDLWEGEGLRSPDADCTVVVVVTMAVPAEELGWGDISAPTLNMACWGWDMLWWSIMGNMLRPFLPSSDDEPPPPAADTAAAKPWGNPAAIMPEMGMPGRPARRFCMATMESMLPIRPPFRKRGGARPDASDTERRGLGISLRGRRPRRRDPGSLWIGSVRIRPNFSSGRKPWHGEEHCFFY